MKLRSKILFVLILLIIFISILSIVLLFIKDKKEEEKEPIYLGEKIDFYTDFLRMQNARQNIIYSPLSIKYALLMLNEGANGNTKTQLESILNNISLIKYDNIEDVLSLANAVYIRESYSKKIKNEYVNSLHKKYNAELKYDSFETAININNWIEDKTLGIIKNIVTDDMISSPDIAMLLINALAIDMKWEYPFSAKDTYGQKFYLEDGSNIKATTMHMKTNSDSIGYYKDENLTAVNMDLKKYYDVQLEFSLIMPEKNLTEYIKEFSIKDMDDVKSKFILASETKKGVILSMPRFSYDYDLKLKENLKELGITDIFDLDRADFCNISSEKLYVSDILHKANIDFTEKGIKAAATTVVFMTQGISLEEERPIELVINKPFVYMIRDKQTGEVWFVGCVYEPNLWEEDKDSYEYK